jgi:hypothetical protein
VLRAPQVKAATPGNPDAVPAVTSPLPCSCATLQDIHSGCGSDDRYYPRKPGASSSAREARRTAFWIFSNARTSI